MMNITKYAIAGTMALLCYFHVKDYGHNYKAWMHKITSPDGVVAPASIGPETLPEPRAGMKRFRIPEDARVIYDGEIVDGKYSGDFFVEADCIFESESVPQVGTAAAPVPKPKTHATPIVPSRSHPKLPIRSRPPNSGPTHIVPGKYQVTGVRYDGGRNPLCKNELPGWIDVTVASCDEFIAIPCKQYTPDQAKTAARNISEAGVIEVLAGPTGRYQDMNGRHLAVFPMSRLEIDEVEDF